LIGLIRVEQTKDINPYLPHASGAAGAAGAYAIALISIYIHSFYFMKHKEEEASSIRWEAPTTAASLHLTPELDLVPHVLLHNPVVSSHN
jgi:hypothetical protein